MAEISFDIKYRPQIESGEYQVKTQEGDSVRIVSWNANNGAYPIIGIVSSEGEEYAIKYTKDGLYNRTLVTDMDLICVTPEPELSEFENRLRSCIIENFTTITKDGNGNELTCTVYIDDKNAKKLASEILSLAREEIEKEKKSGVVEKLREISTPADEDWFEIQKQWEKEDEQKNVPKEEYVKRFKALCDAYEIKLPNREYDIYHLCNDLSKLFTDSDEQKSIEWSDEDEKRIKQLIYDTEHIRAEYEKRKREMGERFNNELIKDCDEQIAWLKDLLRKEIGKNNLTKWSDEDERKYQCVRNILLSDMDKKVGEWKYSEILEWYEKRGVGRYTNSKHHWKPNEEQMKALLKLEETYVLDHERTKETAWLYMVIKNLREQLLKLMKGEL